MMWGRCRWGWGGVGSVQAWLDQVGYSEQPNTECLILNIMWIVSFSFKWKHLQINFAVSIVLCPT